MKTTGLFGYALMAMVAAMTLTGCGDDNKDDAAPPKVQNMGKTLQRYGVIMGEWKHERGLFYYNDNGLLDRTSVPTAEGGSLFTNYQRSGHQFRQHHQRLHRHLHVQGQPSANAGKPVCHLQLRVFKRRKPHKRAHEGHA